MTEKALNCFQSQKLEIELPEGVDCCSHCYSLLEVDLWKE